jgi:hypothetical protein
VKNKSTCWGIPACLTWIITRNEKLCEEIDQDENVGHLDLSVKLGCNGINTSSSGVTTISQAQTLLHYRLKLGHLRAFAVAETGDRRPVEQTEWKGRYFSSRDEGFYVGFLAAPIPQSALTTTLKDIQIVVADMLKQWPRRGPDVARRKTGPKTGKTEKIYNQIMDALREGTLTPETYLKMKDKEFLRLDCRSLDTVRKARAMVAADLDCAGIPNSGK